MPLPLFKHYFTKSVIGSAGSDHQRKIARYVKFTDYYYYYYYFNYTKLSYYAYYYFYYYYYFFWTGLN